ncbi:hypothetical protein Tco_1514649 [Tanacetum coccineum]
MDTKEVSNRYVAPCFVNGLEAYDGEINLGMEENMISNEFSLKLCREYEGGMLRTSGVVLGRSFMRLTQGIADFKNKTITIYPKLDPFLDSAGEEEKIGDEWDLLLDDLDFGDILDIKGVEIPPFVCKMGKRSRKKRKQLEKYQLIYSDMGPSMSIGKPLTHEEAEREALAISIYERYSLLEEERPVIETMAYSDKYKEILDGIFIDKMKLDGEMKKEEEDAIIKIKGEALKEKEDPGAFVIPIRLEGEINLNALAYTGSDINVRPYCVYMELGREELKNVNRGITMLNHSKAEPMGLLKDVICQTSLDTTESDSDDEEDITALQYVDWKPDYTRCFNKKEEGDGQWHVEIRLTDHYGNIYDQTMGTHDDEAGSSRSKCSRQHEIIEEDVLNQMGCDEEIDDMLRIRLREAETNEEIFTSVAWIRAFNINEPIYVELCHEFYSTYEFDKVCADDELQTKKIIKFRLGGHAHSLTLLEFARRLGLYQAVELDKEGLMFTLKETPNGYANVAWLIARWMKTKGAGTQKESQICCGQFISKISRKCRVLTKDVVRSLSDLIYCRDLDTITLRDLIESEGKLIPEDPQPGVPRVGIPRPPRASMQDLYNRMGRIEIRQEAIERMEYRQSYH